MVFRAVFLAYAAVLLVLTHWPRLVVHGPVERTDLYIHAGAFGLWNALFIGSQLAGPWHRGRVILACTLLSAAFAAADEASQMIPIVGRTSDPMDVAANVAGTMLAGLAAFAASRWSPTRRLGTAWLGSPTRAQA